MPPRKRVELTSELIATYCKVLDKTTPQIAASAVGVSARQMTAWLEAGREPDCTDDLLRELAEAEGRVQSGGTRQRLMNALLEAAEVDPKVALEVAKMLMPSLTAPKQVNIDATVKPAAPRIDWSKATDEQLKLAEEYARTVAQLGAGDE